MIICLRPVDKPQSVDRAVTYFLCMKAAIFIEIKEGERAEDQANNLLITPGMMMRFKSVHTFTAKLPLVNPIEQPELVGHSTETSIQSGVIHGLVAEIDGIIDRYRKKYPHLRVILCGGDAPFFENKLKASIFASPDLVLLGLNSVLIHNESI